LSIKDWDKRQGEKQYIKNPDTEPTPKKQEKTETTQKTRPLTLFIDGTLQKPLKALRSFKQNFVTVRRWEQDHHGSQGQEQTYYGTFEGNCGNVINFLWDV